MSDPDGDGLADLSPVVAVSELDLLFNPATQRYEVVADLFTDPGIYVITCRASDVFGSVSFPKRTFVEQAGFIDKLLIVLGGDPASPDSAAISRLAPLVYYRGLQRLFVKGNIHDCTPT